MTGIYDADALRERRNVTRVESEPYFLHVRLGAHKRHVDMLAGTCRKQRVRIALRLQFVACMQVIVLPARFVVDDECASASSKHARSM